MKEKIVADGERRYTEVNRQEIEAEQKQRVAEIRERYRIQLQQSGFWQRPLLKLRMKREIRGVLDSSGNLYLEKT